jgi:hypothetical protein
VTGWSGSLAGVPKLEALNIPASLVLPETAFTSVQGKVPSLRFTVAGSRYELALDNRAIVDKNVTNKKLIAGPSLSGEITIPAGVGVIGRYAFSKNTNITKITVSGDVRELEQYAFEGCRAQIDLGGAAKLQELSSYVFYQNANMGDMTIPASITNIRANAFNSAGVVNVTLPDTIKNIENDAFLNSTLASINFPAGIVSLGAAFGGTKLTSVDLSALTTITAIAGFNNCANLESITLPPYLMTVGASAFAGSAKLAGLVLPELTGVIGDNAFQNCKALTELALPPGVTSVGASAFSGSGLASMTLPENLEALGNNAFASCAGLQWVEFLYEDAPVTANANAFPTTTTFEAVYVPDVLFTAYAGSETAPSSWGNATLRGKVARHSSKP